MTSIPARLRALGVDPVWLLPIPFVVYFVVVLLSGAMRWDHWAVLLAVLGLAFGGARTRLLFLGLYPLGLVAVVYDGMRYIKDWGVSPERVHDCDLRALELYLFGFDHDGARITLGDWFLTHHATALDLYCAIPYGTFIFACIAAAVVLYVRDERAFLRFTWIFFVMNLAAFVTYHVFPAAPPWYFHAHGCEVSMTALPSAGPRLTHVDEVLGIHYFQGIYGRSSDLYGAVPSLHCAYPVLIVLEGWRAFRWPGRVLSLVFCASMSFAAVYLDHHWIVDVLLGYTYCLTARALVRFVEARATPPAYSNSFST